MWCYCSKEASRQLDKGMNNRSEAAPSKVWPKCNASTEFYMLYRDAQWCNGALPRG